MTPCPIVTALQRGQQPWHTHHGPRPVTALGQPYPGAASLLLWLQSRPSPVWLSSAMAERLGGSVRLGEAPTAIPEGEVYNAAQIDGWTPALPERTADPAVMLRVARAVQDDRTGYSPTLDVIHAQDPTNYARLAAPLIQWTARRLGRDLPPATEIMVAEIGGAFLCADWGLAPTLRPDQKAFTRCWQKRPGEWQRAANAAGHACNYLASITG